MTIVGYPNDRPPLTQLRVGRGAAGKAFKMRSDQSWVLTENLDDIEYPIEKTVKDLSPQAILALPLFVRGTSGQLHTDHPVGVLSIVDERERKSGFKEFFLLRPDVDADKQTRLRKRKEAIEAISMPLSDHLVDFFRQKEAAE